MLDAALEYASRDVPVFPTWGVVDGRCLCGNPECDSPGKHPHGRHAPRGFKDATTDTATIRRWWSETPDANVATRTSWCVVLDVDPKAGGDDSLAAMEHELGALPDTPRVLTGSGGTHYYFALPAGLHVPNSAGKLGPGLDVRGPDGYVLLPPSRHASGRDYIEDAGAPLFETPLPPIPAELLARATAARGPNGNDAPVDWAAQLAGVPEGQRHRVAAQIAGRYLSRGLAPGEVTALLELWAARCVPPFSSAEAYRIVADLARKDAARHSATAPPDGWPVYDAAEAWAFPAATFTVEDLLPARGVVWVGGMPKRFKSLLMQYVCYAIACQRPTIADRFAIRQHPRILYVAREDGGGRLEGRGDDIRAPWGVRPAPGALRFLIRPALDLLAPEAVAWVRDLCQREGITLLVLDTWTALSPTADPMAPHDQARLSAVVVQLAQDIGGAVVVVDHSRKNRPEGQPLSSADIFGPLQKWAAAEHIVMLDVVSTEQRRLECFLEGKDGETRRFFLTWSPRQSGIEKFAYAGTIDEIADKQRAVGDANREAVATALVAAGLSGLSPAQATAALKARGVSLAPDTVKKHLRAIALAGQSRKTASGSATRYVWTSSESRPVPSDAIGTTTAENPFPTHA